MAYGISNSFKRGTLKTYSRPVKRVRDNDDVDVPIKKIRMDDTGNVVEETVGGKGSSKDLIAAAGGEEGTAIESSSTTAPSSSPRRRDAALFSSDAAARDDDYNSPPSSPPLARLPSPVAKSRKPAFSFLKRKRLGSGVGDASARGEHEPLTEITDNVGTATEKAASKTRRRGMTQMQIDLGGEVRRACKTCGMDYIPSNAEDAGLHKKFHTMNVGGVWMRKVCLREMKKRRVVDVGERVLGQGQAVVVVDGRSVASVRYEAKRVLEVVNTELSAAGIGDEELWGQASVSSTSKRKPAGRRGRDNPALMDGGDRFKVYLYLDRDTCVGLCLAEKIEHAYRVVDSDAGDELSGKVPSLLPRSSSISTSETAEAALLGISRIWTSTSHRRKGIAAALLDAARRNFFYGMEVPKEKIAFSQPTESGGQLAEYWFDATAGWLVYSEVQ